MAKISCDKPAKVKKNGLFWTQTKVAPRTYVSTILYYWASKEQQSGDMGKTVTYVVLKRNSPNGNFPFGSHLKLTA